jgi:hypothetical protein
MTAALAAVKRGVRVKFFQRPSCVGSPLHVNLHRRVAELIRMIISLEFVSRGR